MHTYIHTYNNISVHYTIDQRILQSHFVKTVKTIKLSLMETLSKCQGPESLSNVVILCRQQIYMTKNIHDI